MKKTLINGFLTALCIVIAAVGMSMTLKANIGVGSINAFSTTLSSLFPIQVGTVLIIVNILCVIIQYIIQREHFHWRQWLQLGVSYVLGQIVNIMFYHVFSKVTLNDYMMRFIWFLLGTIICGFMVAIIIRLNLVVFPIEAMCQVVSDKFAVSFKRMRQLVDMLALILVLLGMVFGGAVSIREGTVLNLLLFPTVIHYALGLVEKWDFLNLVRYND